MIQGMVFQCRFCGCYFMLTPQEMQTLQDLGVTDPALTCNNCRNAKVDTLQIPEKLFCHRCTICQRTFVTARYLPHDEPSCRICPECAPGDGALCWSDYERQLNKDLGYPR